MPTSSDQRSWSSLRRSWAHQRNPLLLMDALAALSKGGDWHGGRLRQEKVYRERARTLLEDRVHCVLEHHAIDLAFVVTTMSARHLVGITQPSTGLLALISSMKCTTRTTDPRYHQIVDLTSAWLIRYADASSAAPSLDQRRTAACKILALAINDHAWTADFVTDVFSAMITDIPESVMADIRCLLKPEHRTRFDLTYETWPGLHAGGDHVHPGYMTVPEMARFFALSPETMRNVLPQLPSAWRCSARGPVRYSAPEILSLKQHEFYGPQTWKRMRPTEKEAALRYLTERAP